LIRKCLTRKIDRVSDKGAERLAQILEDVGSYLATRAIELADHAERKTVTDKDIDLAYKQSIQPKILSG
jgi:histone H3/H4